MNKQKILTLFLSLTMIAIIMAVSISCEDQVAVTDNGAFLEGTGAARPIKVIGTPANANGGNTIFRSNYTFDRDTCYHIRGFVRFADGAVLTVESGTHVLGEPDFNGTITEDPGTLIIERGSQINAQGTPTCPVVFSGLNKTPGSWGGVVLLGRAWNNLTTGESSIEGLSAVPNFGGFDNSDLGIYGAANRNFTANDNSGTLAYARIEYAGHSVNEAEGNETNGLTMGSVGVGTTLHHVMVSNGFDDGFEWFGGDVNATHLISYKNRDDNLDTDQGYMGKVQYVIDIRCTENISVEPVNGHESNGDRDNGQIATDNPTNAIFANVTTIGPVLPSQSASAVNANFNSGYLFRDGSELQVYNSVVLGYPHYQMEVATGGNPVVEGSVLVAPVSATGTSNFTLSSSNQEHQAFVTNPVTDADAMPALAGLPIAAWNCPGCNNAPNLVPNADRPLIFRADEVSDVPAYVNIPDAFFTDSPFVGAFGRNASDNTAAWGYTTGWIVWDPTCVTYCETSPCQ